MRLHRILSQVTQVERIAGEHSIHMPERARLHLAYGAGRWRKMKGVARVELMDGWIGRAELHWYEAHGTGRVDWKVKRKLE